MFRHLCIGTLGIAAITFSVHAGDREQAKALLTAADALTDPAKSIEMCKKALNADETCPQAHFKLAQCLEQMNKPREAFKEYQNAATLAKNENDTTLERKSRLAAEKLGGGLILISAADEKLAAKLLPLADEALAQEQLETARQAYQAVLVVSPTNEKAKTGLEKTQAAIEARGDPVKSKVAAAKLAEVLYDVAVGKKDDAKKMAAEIADHYAGTAAGKDAAQLLENDFGPPKHDEELRVKQIYKDQAKVKPSSGSASKIASAPAVDIDAVDRAAFDEAKKLPKDKLIPSLKEAHDKGCESMKNAKPGSEGQQKAVAAALEQFIKCEQIYGLIDDKTAEVEEMAKDASARRYSCMKMTILSH